METTRIITLQIETEGALCPSFQALNIVMDKWTPKVLFLLQDGPMRYMQLKRQVKGSTQKMLTQTLRKLEKEGLITRTVHPTSPPTVEYALTPLGQALQAPLQGLLQWATTYIEQFPSIREDYTEGTF